MLPTQEELDEYVASVTEYVHSIPGQVQQLYDRLVSDIQRHGPWPPVVTVPGLGSFEVPVPSPPLEPPKDPIPWYRLGFIEDDDTRRVVGIAGVAGVGLGLGWGMWTFYRMKNAKRNRKESLDKSKMRREVVVVLGADTIAGPALVHALEKRGYVVIASVTTPEAVDKLEKASKGNVKALVLNPKEPASIPYFYRSLNAALSLRFPLNTPGDPYLPSGSSPSALPMTNALVSCISLLPIAPNPLPSPLERLDLSSSYLPILYETHITTLAVIQRILPLFRIATGRQGVGKSRHATTQTSVIVLVPAVASRIGVAFDGARAMAIAGLVKGVEVLRREIGNDTKVVLIDVGSIADPTKESNSGTVQSEQGTADEPDIVTLTKAWSASERHAYASAYETALIHSSTISSSTPSKRHRKRHVSKRRPTEVDTLLSTILPLVHGHKASRPQWHPLWLLSHIERSWRSFYLYLRGYRINVGAGASTYTLASLLPIWLLDSILNIPTSLVSWKHKVQQSPQNSHSTSLPQHESAARNKQAGHRPNPTGRPLAMIEGEERAMSTAPASSVSGGSRRESVGSFEGVSITHDSGDENEKSRFSTEGAPSYGLQSGPTHPVFPEGSLSRDANELRARSPSEGQARTPSVASSMIGKSMDEHGDKITDSWVSLSNA